MKKFLPTLILVLLLGGLVAYTLIYEKAPQKPHTDDPAANAFTVLKLKVLDIKSVDLIGVYEVIRMEKSGDKWILTKPVPARTGLHAVDDIIFAFENIKALERIPAKTDPAPFGFDNPQLRVKFTLRNGKYSTLTFGGKSPIGEKYYLRVGEKKDIYVVDSFVFATFAKTFDELRDKSIADTFARDSATTITVTSSGKSTTCIRDIEQDDKKKESVPASAGWVVNTSRADCTAEAEDVLSFIEFSTANQFVDEPQQPSFYGLDKPRYTISLSFKDSAQTWRFAVGSSLGGSDTYFANQQRKEIYIIDNTAIQQLSDIMLAGAKVNKMR